jgi:hypothetical protein
MKKTPIWPLVFIAVLFFYLGYKACEYDVMMGNVGGNVFNPIREDLSGHQP